MKFKLKKGDLLIGKQRFSGGCDKFAGYYLGRKGNQIKLSFYYPPIKLMKITECHYVYEDRIIQATIIKVI